MVPISAGATLDTAALVGTNFSHANLTGAVLANSTLSGAYLIGANLSGADLHGSTVMGADLSRREAGRREAPGCRLERHHLPERAADDDSLLTRPRCHGSTGSGRA